jgi:hypothetical protein
MLFSSCCSERPDVGVFIFIFFPSDEKKIACSPAIQTIKLVWPYVKFLFQGEVEEV